MTEKEKVNLHALQEELFSVTLVYEWSLRLYAFFGLNPLKFNNILYAFFMSYSILQCIMSLAALPRSMDDANDMMDSLIELACFMTILSKLTIYNIKKKKMADLLRIIENDNSVERYENQHEVRIYIDYIYKAKVFYIIGIPAVIAATLLYFWRGYALGGWGVPLKTDASNITTYTLPYQIIFYYSTTNVKKYITALIYCLPMIPLIVFFLLADASLTLAILAHICAKLAILSHSLFNFARNDSDFQTKIAKAVRQHTHLIRMAKTFESTFTVMMLHQILCGILFMCTATFNVLMNWNQQERGQILTYFMCAFEMIILLFCFCYAGQCLIDESTKVGNALYTSPWYELKPSHLKYYILVLNRAQTPLVITGGKLYLYSLNNFLAVVKTTGAYVSLLRKVM